MLVAKGGDHAYSRACLGWLGLSEKSLTEKSVKVFWETWWLRGETELPVFLTRRARRIEECVVSRPDLVEASRHAVLSDDGLR